MVLSDIGWTILLWVAPSSGQVVLSYIKMGPMNKSAISLPASAFHLEFLADFPQPQTDVKEEAQ